MSPSFGAEPKPWGCSFPVIRPFLSCPVCPSGSACLTCHSTWEERATQHLLWALSAPVQNKLRAMHLTSGDTRLQGSRP